MNTSLTCKALAQFVTTQLNQLYPDGDMVDEMLLGVMPVVMQRLTHCFSQIHKKYYMVDDKPYFHHRHSDHYAMFLYLLSNEAWQQGALVLAEKAFLLNKALHGIDAFYSIQLPEVFFFVHPIGTILGHASYGNYLVVYQNVTVGSDVGGVYPQFGESCVLYAKCSVIGACQIGANAVIAAHAFLRNQNVSQNSLVVGMYPNHQVKPNHRDNRQDFFGR